MLEHDREAIERIIDRCSPGGGDNQRGTHLDRAKAEHQFKLQFEGVDATLAELAELDDYFNKRMEEALKDEAGQAKTS